MKPVALILGGLVLVGAAGTAAFFLGRSTAPAGAAPAAAAQEAAAPQAAGGEPKAPAAEAAAPAPEPPRRLHEPNKPANWPNFSIELAAFRDIGRAREYAAEMRRRKLAVELVETVDMAGLSWYRVRVGRFDDPRQAAARLPEVERTAGIFGIVTTEIPPAMRTQPQTSPQVQAQ
jgi:cell division septation protein DedD